MRPRTEFDLFERQADALDSPCPELLIGGDEGRAGCSYLLRAAAIILCGQHRGYRAVLLKWQEADLRRIHFDGPSGLVGLLGPMQRDGFAEVTTAEIRFKNGSSLTWSGCAREPEVSRLLEQRIDFLGVDDVDEIPEALYSRLRDRVLESGGAGRRVIAATSRASTGWVGRHWNGSSPERGCIPMGKADLDQALYDTGRSRGFREFIENVRPGFRWYKHVEVVVRAMQGLFDGEHRNLAIFMPPQHGKSEVGPRLGASYRLERHPSDWIGMASYGTDSANKRNFDAREFYRRSGGEIQLGAGAVNMWQNIYGGGVWSAGIEGGQTGKPMSFGIIDDGDKDYPDAISAGSQMKKKDWYRFVWRARESMFGSTELSQLLIATRWDPDDLSGYILRQAALAGERWHIVCLPAIFDPEVTLQFTDPETVAATYGDDYAELFPRVFTLEPDWRTAPGEAICPERRTTAEWANFRDNVAGSFVFSAEWQQNPLPAAGGGVFDRSWFRVVYDQPRRPEIAASCRAWDDAASTDGKDATASVLMHKLKPARDGPPEERLVIGHATENRVPGSEVKMLKVLMAQADGSSTYVKTPQDPGAAGKTDAEATAAALRAAGVHKSRIIVHRPTGSKRVRARDFSSVARPQAEGDEHGLVDIVVDAEGMIGGGEVLLARFLDVLHRFRGAEGQEDDLIDAAVDAHAQVRGARSKPQIY